MEKLGAAKNTTDGKGQELVVAGRGLARGGYGRRALTALEFQGLAAVPHEAEWFCEHRQPEDAAGLPDRPRTMHDAHNLDDLFVVMKA